MDTTTVVSLVKARLGISTTVRDAYLTAIANGVIDELQDEKGLELDASSPSLLMFVVDYTTWRYQSRDESGALPRHLQFRLHNLIIHTGAKNLRVDDVVNVAVLPEIPVLYTAYILPDSSANMFIDGVWTEVTLSSN